MITFTTPTIPVRVNNGHIEDFECDIYGTFSQGDNQLTINPFFIRSEPEKNSTLLLFELTQLQSSGFHVGETEVEINIVDSLGYRAATKKGLIFVGENLINEVMEYAE